MDSLDTYTVATEVGRWFEIEIFANDKRSDFLGRICRAVGPFPTISNLTDVPEFTPTQIASVGEMTSENMVRLLENCKRRIASLGGEIVLFVKA